MKRAERDVLEALARYCESVPEALPITKSYRKAWQAMAEEFHARRRAATRTNAGKEPGNG